MVDFGKLGEMLGITGAYASTPVVVLHGPPTNSNPLTGVKPLHY